MNEFNLFDCLNVRCGPGDATACVFGQSHGWMKCKDETVSTLVCMCNHIRLYVHNNSTRPSTPKHETWSTFSTEVQLIKAVCTTCRPGGT